MKKAVFLDRDGVINVEKNYLYRIEDFEWIEGVVDAVRAFAACGYLPVVVTNQSGIGRGYYTEEDFSRLTRWMIRRFADSGAPLAGVYYCPHAPKTACACRKPAPGMFDAACRDLKIDMAGSWMIGDKESDIDAAIAAGVGRTVLVRSGHAVDEASTRAKFVVNGIFDTIGLICEGEKQ